MKPNIKEFLKNSFKILIKISKSYFSWHVKKFLLIFTNVIPMGITLLAVVLNLRIPHFLREMR